MSVRIILGAIILLSLQSASAQVDSIKYGLKGKIIRALSASPHSNTTFYAGLKGKDMGAALLYKSEDAGVSWNVLNNGKPISSYAADIQAVAESQDKDKTIYVGTWKDGLFKSTDRGDSWKRVITAPSLDIRSIKTGIQNPDLVYASTSAFGVMKSIDRGETWQRNEAAVIDSTFKFAWSIEIDERNDHIVYAQTYSDGVWKSTDQGNSWTQILDTKNHVCWDLKVDGFNLWVASSVSRDSISAIHFSDNQGESWSEMEAVPQIGLSQINVVEKNNERMIYVGSWSDGIYKMQNNIWSKVEAVDYDTISEILDDTNGLLIGSWGNGIYRLGQ